MNIHIFICPTIFSEKGLIEHEYINIHLQLLKRYIYKSAVIERDNRNHDLNYAISVRFPLNLYLLCDDKTFYKPFP